MELNIVGWHFLASVVIDGTLLFLLLSEEGNGLFGIMWPLALLICDISCKQRAVDIEFVYSLK